MVVRRGLAEKNTVLAGGMLVVFSARSIASMAVLNEETAFSSSFGRWDLVAIIEIQGRCEKNGEAVRSEEES